MGEIREQMGFEQTLSWWLVLLNSTLQDDRG